MIPMRDGVKLYAVLIIPKGSRGRFPIMLDRTPYSADKATARGTSARCPRTSCRRSTPSWSAPATSSPIEDVRGKYRSEGDYVMNRPLQGAAQPDRGRPFDRRLGHDRLAGEERARDQRPRRHHRHQLRRLHRADEPGEPAPGAQGQRADQPDGRRVERRRLVPQRRLPAGDDQLRLRPDRDRKSDEEWFTGGYDDYATFLRYGSAGAYGHAMGMDQLPFWLRLTQHPAYDEYLAGPGGRPDPRRRAADRPHPARRQRMGPGGHLRRAGGVRRRSRPSPNAHLVLGPWYHGQANGPGVALGPLDWGSRHRHDGSGRTS